MRTLQFCNGVRLDVGALSDSDLLQLWQAVVDEYAGRHALDVDQARAAMQAGLGASDGALVARAPRPLKVPCTQPRRRGFA